MPLSQNLRGALFMAISAAGFTANDTVTKAMSADMNMGQVMVIRGIFATLLIALLAWRRGALARRSHLLQPMLVLRVLCEAFATVFFLIGLAHLPLANVTAVQQALPLAVTMGAALLLGEPVGWRRWLAIFVGFVGVLVIIQPGFEGFSVYSLSVLACVALCTVRDLATRRIPAAVPALLVSTVTAAVVTLLGTVMVVPMGGWTPMTAGTTAALAGCAALLLIGYQFIILAMREGDIGAVAPFRYTALLWAILLGFLTFGDVPDLPMTVGASIVVASGLYTLYREQVVGRRQRRPTPASPLTGMAPDGI